MIKLRYQFVILTVWMVFLFNVERLIRPVDINKYTYVLAALVVLIILLIPASRGVPMWLMVGIPSVLLVLLQIWDHEGVWGKDLPVTVTEISSVILTGLLTRRLAWCMFEFEDSVDKIAIDYMGTTAGSIGQEQGIMYNELKRARLYKRPLSLLLIEIDPQALKGQLSEMFSNYRTSLLSQMAMAKICRALDQTLFDTDIIARDHNSFIVMLPELNQQSCGKVISKVNKAVKMDMGIECRMAVASFPEDAVTFERLLEIAGSRLGEAQPESAGAETDTPAGDESTSTGPEGNSV